MNIFTRLFSGPASAEPAPPYWTAQATPPVADLAGIVLAACSLWSSTIATAAPAAGPLTARLLADCGYRLARRGRWTAVIEIDGDGDPVLTPFDAWPNNGVWTGATRENDGRQSRALQVPSAAVVNVQLPAPPINPLSSTYEILRELESGFVGDVRAGLAGRAVITMDDPAVGMTAEQHDALARDLEDRYAGARNAGRVPVLPAYAKPAQMGGGSADDYRIPLREQLFTEAEAQFGITGLLRPGADGASAHAHWRLAVVRTFTPIANLIEAEASAKLETEIRLDRSAWFAAAHGDRARLIVARANATSRLVTAGMSIADAQAAVAALDDD